MNLNVRADLRTDGIGVTVVALAVGLGAIIAMAVTASEAATVILPLSLLASVLFIGFLLLGSARWVGTSSAPMVAAVMLESGFADPTWVRSIVLGCWWFVAIELAWEAIDRRHGARYTTAAALRRVQEVVTVVGVSLVVGLIAASATSLAPVRSVAMQAIVLAGLLVGFVSLVRHVATPASPDQETRY